jgi:hypothetical protein
MSRGPGSQGGMIVLLVYLYCCGERSLYCEREVLNPSGIVISLAGCEDQILQLGAQEGGDKDRRREKICWLRVQIKTVRFILIYHKHSSMDVSLERG